MEKTKNGLLIQRKLYLAPQDVVDYIHTELNFPTIAQAAVLEKCFSNGVTEQWYLLTSLPEGLLPPKELLTAIRKHWQIENCVHNLKDKLLKEDSFQGHSDTLVESLTILRNVVISAWNRITEPAKRLQSRAKDAIFFSCNPTKAIDKLKAL